LSGVKIDGESLVRFVYVDESGISIHESVTVVAGIIVNADLQWKAIERHLDALITKYVPPEHRHGFVFHAKDLFHGSGKVFDRKKYPIERSREALKEILMIPIRFYLPLVYGIARKGAAPKNSTRQKRRDEASTHQAKAFSLCVLEAESYMRERAGSKEIAALVAENNTDTRKMVDRIHQILRGSVHSKSAQNILSLLSRLVPDCLPITKIVDHVYFAKKNDAVLLQIADACALIIRYFCEGRSDAHEFFDALTQNRPNLLKIGEGKGSGCALIDFSRKGEIRKGCLKLCSHALFLLWPILIRRLCDRSKKRPSRSQ